MKRITILQISWAALSTSFMVGCGAPRDIAGDFQNEDPNVRIAVIRRSGQDKLESAIPYLVDRLTDSEAEVRMFAIMALQKITGLTHDYRYYQGASLRQDAVGRWRKWIVSKRVESDDTLPVTERKTG